MPRTRVSLNAKAHRLGWLKPINLELRRLTKTTKSNNCKSLPKFIDYLLNNHLPVALEKSIIFAQWSTTKLINSKT